MTAILTLIYCWLQEFFFSLTDWGLGHLGFPALRGGQHARAPWARQGSPCRSSLINMRGCWARRA